jgi:hypothetical protein
MASLNHPPLQRCFYFNLIKSPFLKSMKGALLVALCLQLALLIGLAPAIASGEHYHQTMSHGLTIDSHQHANVIAQADTNDLGSNHVHNSDSLQLHGMVSAGSSDTPHLRHKQAFMVYQIDYADIFLDGLLRPPRA